MDYEHVRDVPSLKIIEAPSPFFDPRPEGAAVSLIVLHFTGGKSFDYALETLTKGRNGREVSAHYLIREDGAIFRLVAEDKRARHAGVSAWRGKDDVNSRSIGIELSNRDGRPYPPAQLEALAALCGDLRKRYGIPPENIVGHSDVAPDRKDDPGAHFPWKDMAKRGIGVMPKTRLRDHFNLRALRQPAALRELFARAGYGGADMARVIRAFQQHYAPKEYLKAPGKPTRRTVAKLRAVARNSRD
jgi:N-acetylmuramoyl-L-alanine amidase